MLHYRRSAPLEFVVLGRADALAGGIRKRGVGGIESPELQRWLIDNLKPSLDDARRGLPRARWSFDSVAIRRRRRFTRVRPQEEIARPDPSVPRRRRAFLWWAVPLLGLIVASASIKLLSEALGEPDGLKRQRPLSALLFRYTS